jgi:hypothetical protein
MAALSWPGFRAPGVPQATDTKGKQMGTGVSRKLRLICDNARNGWSAHRAEPALQAGGRRFESDQLHHKTACQRRYP